MRALREAFGGLLLAAITTCTVLGGILLAVSETRTTAPPAALATQTFTATTAPTVEPTRTSAPAISPSPTTLRLKPSRTPTPTLTAVATAALAPSATLAPSNTSQPPTPAIAPSLTPTVCAPPGGWVAYTVRPGDTLFRIGLRYGLTVTELEQANCLAGDSINYGQRIFVPPLLTSAAPTQPAAAATPTHTPSPLRITNITLVQVEPDAARPPNGAVAFVRIEFTGGLPPYTFYDEGKKFDNPIQANTECGGTVIHTARVDSADGQTASQAYYFSPIICP